MGRMSSGPLISGGLVAGFGAVVSLVLPWFDVVGRKRSSIDILRSASALDVIDGWLRLAVIAAWLLLPVVLTGAIFLGAAGRHKVAAGTLLPIGLVTLLVAVIGLIVDEVSLAWGAVFGTMCALCASALAMMVLLTSSQMAGGNT